MANDWYLNRAGAQYGPYSWEQLRQHAQRGLISKDDLVWHPETDRWVSAAAVPGLLDAQPAVRMASRSAGQSDRRRRGCLGCALGAVGAAALLVLGGWLFFRYLQNRPSDNLTVARAQRLARQQIAPEGGTLTVDAPGQPLDGLTIVVPAGAYEEPLSFTVSSRQIEAHDLGPYFSPRSPLITVDNGGGCATTPMLLTIPVSVPEGEFAMAFYYDRHAGKLEGIPAVAVAADSLTVAARHFSDVVVSSIPMDRLQGAVDTGFRPGQDDWQFPNYGSVAAPGGHCEGQAMSAMWYYYERYLEGQPHLYGLYDNNARGATADLWQDDSLGYRLASSVQEDVEWDSRTDELPLGSETWSDALTWAAFAYTMQLTGNPQFVSIADSSDGSGHALVAYRMDAEGLYVGDPSFPGQERVIRFSREGASSGTFQPYASGDVADEAQTGSASFEHIGYHGVSAMVDWDAVGRRFAELDEGAVGGDLFPAYTLSVYRQEADEEEPRIAPLYDGMYITEEETARIAEHLRGKLHILFACGPQYDVYVYRGTTLLGSAHTGRQEEIPLAVPLELGANDLGFYVVDGAGPEGPEYVDFLRCTVHYEQPSLEGHWEGTFAITEAERVRNSIVQGLTEALVLVRGEEWRADASAAVQRAVVPVENLTDERPFALDVVATDRLDRDTIVYEVTIQTWDADGSITKATTRAIYRKGVFSFAPGWSDGTRLVFEGWSAGQDRMVGNLSITAWGLLKDAATGQWKAERTGP